MIHTLRNRRSIRVFEDRQTLQSLGGCKPHGRESLDWEKIRNSRF